MNLQNAQAAMHQEKIDCWLVHDFQKTNPIMRQLLPLQQFVSRRLFLIVPAEGVPMLLGSKIDQDALRSLPYHTEFYVSWKEMEQKLAILLTRYQTIALDYSPGCALPVTSRLDAGTFELIKRLEKTIKSAANIFQAAAAIWSEEALQAHLEDCRRVAAIKDEAFEFIAASLRNGSPITEYDVQQFIMQQFAAEGLVTPYPPIVGVNANSGDPHYSPTATKHVAVNRGDWILIDLWAKRPGYDYIFADMAWVGFAGQQPPAQHRAIFKIVRDARDAGVAYLQNCTEQGLTPEGWQLDDVVRQHITAAGYGAYFFHRTGHNLGPGDNVHGQGANIDNLETHDTRKLVPGIGFSIEPGIYLPDFGVRAEINVYMDQTGPRVTTPSQQDIICLDV